jgi:phage terminase large subunit GpA-like protein
VRSVHDARLMPIKGISGGAALIGTPTAVDATASGKKLRRGIKVFPVAGGIAKLEFYNNLRKSAEVAEDGVAPIYPAGFVHLPKVDAEYLQQLCAEQLITRRDRNGFAHREWQKMRERNEALDCYVYARAAAAAAGLDRFEDRHWLELEKQLGVGPALNAQQITTPVATQEQKFDGGLSTSGSAKPNPRRVVRSKWMN